MKLGHGFILAAIVSVVFLVGCETFQPSRTAGDFVRSTNFSPLDSFTYRDTILTGMPLRLSDQEETLKQLSAEVLVAELAARGFVEDASAADFYVVTTWHKQLSHSANIFDSVDGPAAVMNRRSEGTSVGAVRFTVIVELYDAVTNDVFWRAEMPDVFDAIQFSESRVSESLLRAIQNFPKRIEKDPNLPNIE